MSIALVKLCAMTTEVGLDTLSYILLFAAGVLAGVINTVGGGGSVLTLPALIFIGGLSSPAANATNRIGLVAQNSMAIWRFRRGGVKEDRISWRVALAGLPGTWIGAEFASWIPEGAFDKILGILMLALLALFIFKPKPHLTKDQPNVDAWGVLSGKNKAITLIAFFIIGIYMGLIQAGSGIMILIVLGYMLRLDLVRGNYIKLVYILVLNVLAFGIFLKNDLGIDWGAGITVFVGQVAGAYVGSWVALKKGEKWMLMILAVSIILASAKLLGLVDWVWGLF